MAILYIIESVLNFLENMANIVHISIKLFIIHIAILKFLEKFIMRYFFSFFTSSYEKEFGLNF